VSVQLSDPLVLAAVVTGASTVAVAIVNSASQIVCTWLQTRSRKPPAKKPRKPKPRKKRRRLPELARSPPQSRRAHLAGRGRANNM
jgi:hypothetical protein